MGDSAKRRAAEPKTVRAMRMTPSSSSNATETSTGSALVDDALDSGDSVLGADHDEDVAGMEHLRRSR